VEESSDSDSSEVLVPALKANIYVNNDFDIVCCDRGNVSKSSGSLCAVFTDSLKERSGLVDVFWGHVIRPRPCSSSFTVSIVEESRGCVTFLSEQKAKFVLFIYDP
jgi:hypothetical protein